MSTNTTTGQPAFQLDLGMLERDLGTFDVKLRRELGPLADFEIRHWREGLEPVAADAFRQLLQNNCNADDLAWLVMLCRDVKLYNCSEQLGATREKLGLLASNLKERQDRPFDEKEQYDLLVFMSLQPRIFAHHLVFQRTQTELGHLLSHLIENIGAGKHIYLDIAKSLVTHYVKRCTGTFHDEAVIALLASELEGEALISVESFRNWRCRYASKKQLFAQDKAIRAAEGKRMIRLKRALERSVVRQYREDAWDEVWAFYPKTEDCDVGADLAHASNELLRIGDLIVAFDGRRPSDGESPSLIIKDRLFARAKSLGTPFTLTVRRQSKYVHVEL